MGEGRALLVQGNALELPFADGTVDLIVTSPPYLWKRKYAIEGSGELGNEQDWRQYLDHLWAATDELLRVLKPAGSIFVNLDDTRVAGREPKWLDIPPKSLLLLPERYRVGCQDRYASRGVIVRQVQIWEKVNGLPESVDDRTRDSHEDWVMLTKQPRYYSAIDEVRESHSVGQVTGAAQRQTEADGPYRGATTMGRNGHNLGLNPLGKLPGSVWSIPSEPLNTPDYMLPRSRQDLRPQWVDDDRAAWRLLRSGLVPDRSGWPRDDGRGELRAAPSHYAAFPGEWPRRLILGFSPPGICVGCGQGRVPVVDRQLTHNRKGKQSQVGEWTPISGGTGRETLGWEREATILGYACACTPYTDHPERAQGRGFIPDPSDKTAGASANGSERNKAYRESLVNPPRPVREYHLAGWQAPPTRPAVILDPFGGTATVAVVAAALGRVGISMDLSADYCRLGNWRRSRGAPKVTRRTQAERQQTLL